MRVGPAPPQEERVRYEQEAPDVVPPPSPLDRRVGRVEGRVERPERAERVGRAAYFIRIAKARGLAQGPTGGKDCRKTITVRLTRPLGRVERVPPVPVRAPLPPDERRASVEGAYHRHDQRADGPEELGLCLSSLLFFSSFVFSFFDVMPARTTA